MKIKIGETLYDAAALNEISLKMILQLEDQMADFGHPMKWSQIQQIADELQNAKTDRERNAHPDGIWISAVTIWATRRVAGEDLTFDQAVDFPLSQLSYIQDPQDRLNPTKPRPRKGSGVAGSPRRAAPKRTSGRASTPA